MNEPAAVNGKRHDVVIIGDGAGGIAVAASLHKRQPDLDIAIVVANLLAFLDDESLRYRGSTGT